MEQGSAGSDSVNGMRLNKKIKRITQNAEINFLEWQIVQAITNNGDEDDAIFGDELIMAFAHTLEQLKSAIRSKDERPKRSREYLRQPTLQHPRISVAWKNWLSGDCMRHVQLDGTRAAEFKSLFRVPWSVFNWLLQFSADYFPMTRRDCCGLEGAPLELLILGSLATLAQSMNFTALAKMTNVSASVHRTFLKQFTKMLRWKLYPQRVKMPVTADEVAKSADLYSRLSLPGAVCSVDATHIRLWNCPASAKNISTGKEGYPSRAFQVSFDFSRRILHSTKGFYGSWPDQTITKYDDFMIKINNNEIGQGYHWKVLDSAGNSHPQDGGLWAICDGGYKYPNMISPIKVTTDPKLNRLAKWIMTVRKDAECGFGCLKKRFEILRFGFVCRSFTEMDDIFLGICALHNLLMDFDEGEDDWQNECPVMADPEIVASVPVGDGANETISFLDVDPAESDYDQMQQRRDWIADHYFYQYRNNSVKWIKRRM